MQDHAALGAMIDNVFRSGDADWITTTIAEDDRNIIEAVVMTVTLFADLWRHSFVIAWARCQMLDIHLRTVTKMGGSARTTQALAALRSISLDASVVASS